MDHGICQQHVYLRCGYKKVPLLTVLCCQFIDADTRRISLSQCYSTCSVLTIKTRLGGDGVNSLQHPDRVLQGINSLPASSLSLARNTYYSTEISSFGEYQRRQTDSQKHPTTKPTSYTLWLIWSRFVADMVYARPSHNEI